MAKGFWNALTGGTVQGFNQSFGRGWEAEEAREYRRLIQEDIKNMALIENMYNDAVAQDYPTPQQGTDIVMPKPGDINLSKALTPNISGMQLSTDTPKIRQTPLPEQDVPAGGLVQDVQTARPQTPLNRWGYRDFTQELTPENSPYRNMKPLQVGMEIVRNADRKVERTLGGLLEGLSGMQTEQGRQIYQNWMMREKKVPQQLTENDRAIIPLLASAYGEGNNTEYSTYYPLLSDFGRETFDAMRVGLTRNPEQKPFDTATMISIERARQIAGEQKIPFDAPSDTRFVSVEYTNEGRVKSLKPATPKERTSSGGSGGDKPSPLLITKNSEDRIAKFGLMTKLEKNIVRRQRKATGAESSGNVFGFDGVGESDDYGELITNKKVLELELNTGIPRDLLANQILKQDIRGGNYAIAYDGNGGIKFIHKSQYDNLAKVKNEHIKAAQKQFITKATGRGASEKFAWEYLESKTKQESVNPEAIVQEIIEEQESGAISKDEASLLIELLYYETGYLPENARVQSSNINTERQ